VEVTVDGTRFLASEPKYGRMAAKDHWLTIYVTNCLEDVQAEATSTPQCET
jgi:hypothetical protein